MRTQHPDRKYSIMASYMHTNWRDLQAWRDAGLQLSTTSNEAAKLYDAIVTQYVAWYDEPSVGGIEKCIEKIQQEDEDFVMGKVLAAGLELIGTGNSVKLDKELEKGVDLLKSTKDGISKREKLHVEAIELFASGETTGATRKWEEILLENPTDLLALKFAHDTYFYLGYQQQMRDSIARVLPFWKTNMPLYSYLYGMHAFGLVETNFYDQAEQNALKALELNPRDCWATHARAHVLEMRGQANEGIEFLSSTVEDWNKGHALACHNHWHWALYLIEKGEKEAALDIYDKEVKQRYKSGAMLDLVDAASLLYRLQLEGVDVHSRYKEQIDLWQSHTDDHILLFNDAHILMCSLGAKDANVTNKLMTSVQEFIKTASGDNHQITKSIGGKILEAMEAFDEGNAAAAVDLLMPLRYDVVRIGGSDAQRDLWKLLLIHAALQSDKKEHHCLARSLLIERKKLKENSPMTDRLMVRAVALQSV